MKSLISVIILTWSCFGFISATQKRATTVCETETCQQSAQYLLNAMDQTQNPCTDFYQFACGGFIAKNPLPDDVTEYGTPDVLTNNALEIVQDILETPSSSNTPVVQNAQSLYNNCLKQTNDVALLKSEVEKLGGWPITTGNQQSNKNSLEVLLASLTLRGTNAIIYADVDVDFDNSNQYIIEADYGTLPLEKSLFGNENDLEACIVFATTSAEVLGAPNSSVTTNNINQMLQFGSQLVDITPDPEVITNFTKIYQKMTIGQLQQLTDPTGQVFNWLTFYNALLGLELTSNEPVAVYDLDYLVSVMPIIKATDKNTLVNYAMWCFVEDYTWHAGGALLQLHDIEAKALTGVSGVVPRNTTCTEFTIEVFGYALATQYVAKVFPASNAQKVLQVAQLMQSTWEIGITETNIYDKVSSQIAKEKIAAMNFLIGYPEWINNPQSVQTYYKNFPEMNNAHFTNAINGIISLVKQQLQLLHTPVDRSFFDLYPTDVEGYYEYTNNYITLPAGILQQPYFTAGQLHALDFGALGSLVGVLINDGINNVGSQFDQNGNLGKGWPANVQQAVAKDIQCVSAQFDSYCSSTDPTECVNGTDSALEIIGELVAAIGAYNAYQGWLSTNPQEARLPGLQNYTSDQLLFINYAQRHCYATVPANIVDATGDDSQLEHRSIVNGVLANVEEFAQTFQCPLGPMNRGNASCSPF